MHLFRGAIFENLVILEVLKQRLNVGRQPNLYFWRDNTGNEIDLLVADKGGLIPIEIKSGQTITADYLKGILFWNKISDT